MATTYECEICHGINHAVKLCCQFCDTIPRQYSYTGEPIRVRLNTILSFEPETISNTIPVFVAYGCERQISRRTIRRIPRTVKLDYYAESVK